jgi:hypothetical protein
MLKLESVECRVEEFKNTKKQPPHHRDRESWEFITPRNLLEVPRSSRVIKVAGNYPSIV